MDSSGGGAAGGRMDDFPASSGWGAGKGSEKGKGRERKHSGDVTRGGMPVLWIFAHVG